MLQEVQDHRSVKESSAAKRKRDEDLTAAGLRHRDKVARAMIGGEDMHIGGDSVKLSANGEVVEEQASSRPAESISGTGLLSPTPFDHDMAHRGVRKPSKHMQIIHSLMQADSHSELEAKRLNFEMERFAKEFELRKIEHQQKIEFERRKLDADREDRQRQHELALAQMKQRQAQLESQIKQSANQMQQSAQAQKEIMEFKFKKLEMMILAKRME